MELSKLFAKSHATITNWIDRYEENGSFNRNERDMVYLKFNPVHRKWIIDVYRKNPILLLDEVKQQFECAFGVTITTSSICRILHAEGFSYKGIERRAIQQREMDIVRFVQELSIILRIFRKFFTLR